MQDEEKLSRLEDKIGTGAGVKGTTIQVGKSTAIDINILYSIIESSPDGITVQDTDYNIVYANPVMEKLYANRLPLEGKKCFSAYFDLTHPCPDCACRKAMMTARPEYSLTNRKFTTLGSLWFDAQAYPLRGEFGDFEGVIVHLSNATKRKEIEAAKAQADLYLDLMSHDINNMVQMAMGNLEMMREETKDQELKNKVSSSLEVLNGIAMLIRDVGNLKRTQKEELELVPVDISQVLAQVAERYAHLPNKKIRISYRQIPMSMVLANGLIADVFSNLIHNSIKHAKQDGLDININLSTLKLNDKWYHRVIVDDNGPGIPDELKQYLFEGPFEADKKRKGRGLGMYLVKALIDRYHGWIQVENRVQGDYTKGTRVIVMLPAIG